MKRSRRFKDGMRSILYGAIGVIIFVVILIVLFIGLSALDRCYSCERLDHGYVTEKFVDGEHYWYSSWTFGDFSITHRHGGKREYIVTVEDGDTKDYWTVPEEQWQAVALGDYIRR